jgi:hypothetical protein
MGEVLSFAEIKRRYDDEWVIIAYTELDNAMEVVAGEVLAHSPNEAEIYQALPMARGRHVAIEYVGKIPKDLAFVL